MKDVMIDLETLGTRYDAMIIQIGACYFDRKTGEIGRSFFMTVEPKEHWADKFSMDYQTVKWWMEQSETARRFAMENPVGLTDALVDLAEFLEYKKDVLLWSHATFDMPILANAFETIGIQHPVPYRNMRDIRTIMDIAGYSKLKREGVHHHALDDAKYQAKYVSEALQKLNCNHDTWESAVCCNCGKNYNG